MWSSKDLRCRFSKCCEWFFIFFCSDISRVYSLWLFDKQWQLLEFFCLSTCSQMEDLFVPRRSRVLQYCCEVSMKFCECVFSKRVYCCLLLTPHNFRNALTFAVMFWLWTIITWPKIIRTPKCHIYSECCICAFSYGPSLVKNWEREREKNENIFSGAILETIAGGVDWDKYFLTWSLLGLRIFYAVHVQCTLCTCECLFILYFKHCQRHNGPRVLSPYLG